MWQFGNLAEYLGGVGYLQGGDRNCKSTRADSGPLHHASVVTVGRGEECSEKDDEDMMVEVVVKEC